MSPLRQMLASPSGWADIVAGRASWRDRFTLTGGGLLVAVLAYLITVSLRVGTGFVAIGPFEPTALVRGGLVNLMPLGGLMLSTLLTYLTLRVERPMLDLLVPGVYALALTLLGGTLLVFFGIVVGPLVLAILALMLARAAQVAGGFGIGVSLAYAALTVVLLVVLNDSLYMLMAPPLVAN